MIIHTNRDALHEISPYVHTGEHIILIPPEHNRDYHGRNYPENGFGLVNYQKKSEKGHRSFDIDEFAVNNRIQTDYAR